MDYKTQKLDPETKTQLIVIKLDELTNQLADLSTRIKNLENEKLPQETQINSVEIKELKKDILEIKESIKRKFKILFK